MAPTGRAPSPPWEPDDGRADNVALFGGIEGKRPALQHLSLTDGKLSAAAPPLPVALTTPAVATADGGDLYVVGGLVRSDGGATKVSSATWRLDGRGQEWQRLDDMTTARVHHTLAASGGRLLAIGGMDDRGSVLDSVEMFVPEHNQWQRLAVATMPQPCLGMASCQWNGLLWLHGGVTPGHTAGGVVSHKVFAFNSSRHTWYRAKALPVPRAFARATVVRDTIYIVGGISPRTEHAAEVLRFQASENAWQSSSILNCPRHHFAVAVKGEQVYVIGGISANKRNRLTSVEKLDVESDESQLANFNLTVPFVGVECS